MDLESRVKFGRKILKWFKRGHILGPFAEHGDPTLEKRRDELRVNPVFTVDKPDSDVRPVINYSKELNDGGPSLNGRIRLGPKATVEYLHCIEIIATLLLMLQYLGAAMVWAQDLDEGYHNCRVQPSQVWALAFSFAGFIFVPMVLAMGLSSAPLIFTIFMWHVVMAIRLRDRELTYITVPITAVDRSLWQTNADLVYDESNGTVDVPLILYYLDDIFGIGHPSWVWRQFYSAKETLRWLSLWAKVEKDRVPALINILLGVEYDIPKRCCRTPREKGERYIKFADRILAGKTMTKSEGASLTGKARHMAAHCRTLNSFARSVEVHFHRHRNGNEIKWHHRLNITGTLRADIQLLRDGIQMAMHHDLPWSHIIREPSNTEIELYTDAAGVHGGIGGFVDVPETSFFQIQWQEVELQPHCDILWKELVALYVALRVNLQLLRGRHVGFYSDNEPIIWMLIKGRSPMERPDLQLLIREFHRLCLYNTIEPWWAHISGDDNVTADKLSRFIPNPFADTDISPKVNQHESALASLRRALIDTKRFKIDSNHLVL